MDPMTKMLCNMLGIKPDELRGGFEEIKQSALWFAGMLNKIDRQQGAILSNQQAMMAQLGIGEHYDHGSGNPGELGRNGDGGNAALGSAG